MNRYWVMMLLSFVASLAHSSDYPLEFADLFLERNENVEVVIAGEVRSQAIEAFVSYETFRLDGGTENIARLSEYLRERRLTDKAIDNVVSQVMAGVKANPGCKGALSLCVPRHSSTGAEFVFDFDARKLRMFVDGSMLDRQSYDDEYYSPDRPANALINWSDLYVYTDGKENNNLNWTNNATLGLPVGFLSVETRYQQPKNEFKLYQALYDVEKEDLRALVGYQGRQAVTFNSTDFLYNGANYAGFGASFGRSQHLFKGQKQAQKRIYFFAPEASQLEVYQGERLLFNKVVSQGQQSIGYDELPSGVYKLTLVLKKGSEEILNEQHLVVNTAQFSLPVSRWDYRVDVGMLKDLASDEQWLDDITTSERGYVRGALAYRPSEGWLLAPSLTSNGDDSLLNVGGHWVFNDSLNAQYNIGTFTSGSLSHYGQVELGPLSASYRYVNANEKISTLATLLYGQRETRDWGIGIGGQVLGGTGYLNYNNYQIKREHPWNIYASPIQSESDNVSLSWSREAFGGRLSVNTTYSIYHGEEDTWNTTLAWSMSFGEHFSARSYLNADREGQMYNRNSVTYQSNGDYGYASSTASIKRGRESDTDISSSLNGHRRTFNYSAYAYASQEGQRSLSGSLSGTQILSTQGGALTYEKARAFVSLNPTLTEPELTPIDMSYNMLRDGKFWYRDKAPLTQSTLIKLDDYTNVAFELDADTNNIDIMNHQYDQFVMPGYYYQLHSEVTPLTSQVFLLNDMLGNPISTARCLGYACKGVEVLSDDGVVRVNYRKGRPFKLVSQNRLCVYDPNLMGEGYIQTYCLPGLDDIDNNIVWNDEPNLITPDEKENALLYIGKYESTAESARILERLQEVGLASKAIKVGESMYVYVRYLKLYTTAQRELLQGLDLYVILDSIHIDQLFSER